MKQLQKPISILLSLIMILSIFTIVPFEAGAVSGVSYIERSWDGEKIVDTEKISGESTVLSEGMDVNLSEGWYVLREDVTLSERLMIDSGTVDLILCDGATLTDNAGIGVGMNATLNIYGQSEDSGKIAVTLAEAVSSYAAIGGTGGSAGIITVHGGTLELTNKASASKGASIGGGQSGSPNTVTIYGGTIKSETTYGAGIGGGRNAAASSNSGKEGIIIYGGNIEAKSSFGAGIGNGYDYDGSPGSIAIYGGIVKASSVSGAGIGGGNNGRNGMIDIYGGDIIAVSTKSGAGIGSGRTAHQVNDINIHGGTVYA